MMVDRKSRRERHRLPWPVQEADHAWVSADCPPTTGGNVFEVRLLGPVRAIRLGGEIALGGPKQRAVLALLLLEAGRVVSAARLVEEVWLGRPPPGAAKTLRSYVSRLRTLLASDVDLAARGGGYVLTVDTGHVDVDHFERLVAAGHAALANGDAAAAAGRFAEALGLWHGRALADVCEVETLALESARLEELRLTAIEGRIEADIASGRHAQVTGELERLVAEHPVRERLWRLLVLALYRDERQADALAASRRARDTLATELGLEPGEELRRLEQAVLRQEVPAARPPLRHNLPAPLTSFLGRGHDLAELDRLLGAARLITLTGPGGAGKTRLAVEVGTRAVERFPDGVWLADLAGIADPDLVPAQVMEALGVRQEGDMPVTEALRYRLRSADLLLLLDNCEHLLDACTELSGALLRSSPGLRVLATSREPLGLPGEVTYQVRPLAVPPEHADSDAATAPAVQLFLDRASAARGGAPADAGLVGVAGRISRKLDGLPLAIELAAARMGTLSAAEIEAHLSDLFRFLAYRRPAGDPRHQALQAAMDWSYELLSPDERRMLRELSVFAGGFGLAQVAEVCTGGDAAAALEVIDRLASKSLVTTETAEDATRYRLLETVRQYAADRLAAAGGTQAARELHALAFLHLAERERGLSALSREHGNFRAALEWSLAQGGQARHPGPQLAHALGDFWLARGLLAEGRNWLERALVAPAADQGLLAGLLRLLGATLYEAGDLDAAEAVLSKGSGDAAAAGTPAVGARIGVLLAEIHNMQGESNAEALAECEAAAAILESQGDLDGLAEAWMLVGKLRLWLDDPAAGEALERAIGYARQSGHHRAQMRASHWLVATFHRLPIPADTAVARAEKLLHAASGDPWAEADLLKPLCILYAYVGRAADARAALARGRAIFAGFGAKFALAESGISAGWMELTNADPVAAERYLREAYEALRAMGERRYFAFIAAMLAEALYAQGRFDEAQQMSDEVQAADVPDAGIWATSMLSLRAKILARNGQFPAARRLVAEAEALITPASSAVVQTEVLQAKAEVDRLAGAQDQAAASLRAALRIYENRRATQLAAQIGFTLASLAADTGISQA
jgi:predicted ATPase/DNA-binding SARP family transcriptional activator